jgi:hypothetical protein
MEQRQADVLIDAARRSTKLHQDQKDYCMISLSRMLFDGHQVDDGSVLWEKAVFENWLAIIAH